MIKFHHIGIACADIGLCKNFIKSLTDVADESEIIFDENQNASLCLLTLRSGVRLELVSGPMVADLVKKGITYYHTCYSVPDIEKAISLLKKPLPGGTGGVTTISEIKPGKLFNGQRAVFLYTPIGIVELLENKQ